MLKKERMKAKIYQIVISSTGIQLIGSSNGVNLHLFGRELLDFNLGILGKQIDETGRLPSSYVNMNNTIPGLRFSNNNFKITNNAIIEFGVSNEEMDVGQSFVPYFDGSDITFDVKAPLSGIGLIYYTNDYNYAGYIRPVVNCLDYRKYIETAFIVGPAPEASKKSVKSFGVNLKFDVNILFFFLFVMIRY
jgi:hypothetical protein